MTTAVTDLSKNLPRLAGFNALQMTLFPVAIITLYQNQELGLSMTEILLLQGIFGLAMVLAEFPSGYVADRIGYRRTLMVAASLGVAGWSAYLVAADFGGILLAELILGIAMALISGCDSALLYESLIATRQESAFTKWMGRIRFAGQSAEGTAALAAGVLYTISPQLPFLLQIPVWVAAFAMAYSLTEPVRAQKTPPKHRERIRRITREALIDNAGLRAIMFLIIVLGLCSFIPVWIIPLYAEAAGVPTAWIGVMWAVANYTVAGTALASMRAEKILGTQRLALVGVALAVIGYTGLSLVHAWWGFVFYFFLTAIRGLVAPAIHHVEQRLIPSEDRAAFLSLRSLLFRLSFFVLAPIVGASIDRSGFHTTLIVIGVFLALACSLAWLHARPYLSRITPLKTLET